MNQRLSEQPASSEIVFATPNGRNRWPHLILACSVAVYSAYSFYTSPRINPITGEWQNVLLTPEEEIALGNRAAPKMIAQHGGLHPDETAQQRVQRIGNRIVQAAFGERNPYDFQFQVLKDPKSINAFALPGGRVFITAGMLNQLTTDGQAAAVLAHEIGHVIQRHGVKRLAKTKLTEGLTGALILATQDPAHPDTQKTAQAAAALGQLIRMKYGREDELEADRDGVHFMVKAGYDPRGLLRVVEILKAANNGRNPEFFSTHPDPDRRRDFIEQTILEIYPDDLPNTLIP